MLTPEFSARAFDFFARVDQSEPGFCHPWTGATSPSGCGFITFHSDRWDVRDVAFALWNDGPMPPSRYARASYVDYGTGTPLIRVEPPERWHATTTCGNVKCCNPRHLQFQNGARPDGRGRKPALTPRQVALCRVAGRPSQAALAHVFGVTTPTIQAAQRGDGAYREHKFHTLPHFSREEAERLTAYGNAAVRRQQRGRVQAVAQRSPGSDANTAMFLWRNGFTYADSAVVLQCHRDTVRARIRRADPDAADRMSWDDVPETVRTRAERMRNGQALDVD